jgi:plasmid maintenance system antidote protein VapI
MNKEAKTQLMDWLALKGVSQGSFAIKIGINRSHLSECLSVNSKTKMGLTMAQKIHAETGISLDILCKPKQ